MHVQQVSDAKGQKTFHLKSITAHPALDKSPHQNFSPEMLCWDDYREMAGINDGSQKMAQMCNWPGVSSGGAGGASSSGFGQQAQAPASGG